MNTNETLQTTRRRNTKKFAKWKIQFAKFLTFPNSSVVSSSQSSLLRPLSSRVKLRLKGTWLPCSSSNVVLRVVVDDTEPTLVVSLNDTVYEEHYVSKLNFIWPQGYCLDENSKRGSRAIIVCYRDGMDQIQKFALRFSSSEECQKFMEVLKCLKNGSEVDFSSDMLSNVLYEGIERERALVVHSCSQQAALGHAPEATDVALPESFTALLADCFTATNPGAPQAPAEIDLTRFLTEGSKADKPVIDLLEKMDNIIVGLVGDMRF